MNTSTKNYLAVFLGSQDTPVMLKWSKLLETERQQKMKEGGEAWHAWVEKNKSNIAFSGSPLGKTKTISSQGVGDLVNSLCAYTVVKATSHEDAVKMFDGHPHFSIFPGESIEVMECLPIPSAM